MTGNVDAPSLPDGQGWALTRLLKLHAAIRRDLALLRRVNTAVASGDEAAADAALQELALRKPGWTLPAFCAQFCGFVHGHHAMEDHVLFPMLVQHQDDDTAALAEVIDKLKADHRVLAEQLDEVERTLADPPTDPPARTALVEAVDRLSDTLEAHLDFEETQLAAAFNAMSRTVSPDDVPAAPPEHLQSGSRDG